MNQDVHIMLKFVALTNKQKIGFRITKIADYGSDDDP